jgi:hypothetical protein
MMNIFGIDVVQAVITAGIGGLVFFAIDRAFKLILINYFPEKYIVKWIREIDDNYIDIFKKKYPQAGKELEEKIAKTLREAADIIQDIK